MIGTLLIGLALVSLPRSSNAEDKMLAHDVYFTLKDSSLEKKKELVTECKQFLSDQPGIQFYGGNFLDGKVAGKGGQEYPHRSACCLETQVFPDSPTQEDFPSCILQPGDTYSHTMVHKFSW